MHALRRVVFALITASVALASSATAQQPREKVEQEIIAKIKEEGLQRSKAMETLSYLTDVDGPRLTGSPQRRIAGEWTQKKLTEWRLENAHLETWGPFGRGWSLEGFSANMVAPNFTPLIAFPKAWSPSTPTTIRGEPVIFDATNEQELEKFHGKLHRAIVLLGTTRELKAQFDPPAKRQSDEALLALANGLQLPRSARTIVRVSPSTPGSQPA